LKRGLKYRVEKNKDVTRFEKFVRSYKGTDQETLNCLAGFYSHWIVTPLGFWAGSGGELAENPHAGLVKAFNKTDSADN